MPIYCLNHFEVYSSVVVSTFLSVHPSPELFSSCKPDTLGPLNTKSPFPSPLQQLAATILLCLCF